MVFSSTNITIVKKKFVFKTITRLFYPEDDDQQPNHEIVQLRWYKHAFDPRWVCLMVFSLVRSSYFHTGCIANVFNFYFYFHRKLKTAKNFFGYRNFHVNSTWRDWTIRFNCSFFKQKSRASHATKTNA